MKYIFHATLMKSLNSPININFAKDRSDKVNLWDETQLLTLTPIGDPEAKKLTIEELCFQRVNYILKSSPNKQIYIHYSGGIDSTAVVTSFIKFAPKDQFVVYMNDDSIKENPTFYKEQLLDKVQIQMHNLHGNSHVLSVQQAFKNHLKDGIIVTGEIGDQIFGGAKFGNKQGNSGNPISYDLTLNQFLENQYKENPKNYEKILNVISACPRELTSRKDYWWWFQYNFLYQQIQFRLVWNINELKLEKNIFHFFDNKDWNDYSMYTDVEDKYKGLDFKTYKQPLKDYIFEFDKNEDYRVNKVKLPSLTWGGLPRTGSYSIDENWNRKK